ncbi:sulfurtransferase [Bdellovibrio svalbardensis]|uniref:Rhodanese-like domain-containing protein n=1 Tax=Bdellovibrio svalbardensis TaxID=2972972 RepID=A0ABT6DH82_9BACT|nr:rhodanese-like domain-containing protein [Bdellovibrio svalbardensis]MDG0816209.1 rhodanese-like domain-containing protein [Bdellovibrio svalbardensis]
MRSLVLLLAVVGLFAGCQYVPTKVVSQEPVIPGTMTAEKIMADNPVILDVRSPFEFNLSHVPGAINVRWEDFSQQDPRYRGLLQTDLFAMARRLSLIGIDLDSKVVVLGKGRQGGGEEGRVAWTLQVLGVREVYTLMHTSYRAINPKEGPPPVKNKPYWKPVVDESMMISFENFKAYATQQLPPMKYSSRARSKSLGGLPPGATDMPVASLFGMNFNDAKNKVIILDVRGSQEFALQNLTQQKDVKASVVNIEWREFFNDKDLPAKEVEKLLAAKGITKDKIVMVISNHGVRSAAVTYALRGLGYRQSVNYAGGYEQWK